MLIKRIVEIADNKNRAKNIIKKANNKNREDKSFGYVLQEALKKEDGESDGSEINATSRNMERY